ncbi:MAG: TonB family protein [Pseudomonadota bacterium]
MNTRYSAAFVVSSGVTVSLFLVMTALIVTTSNPSTPPQPLALDRAAAPPPTPPTTPNTEAPEPLIQPARTPSRAPKTPALELAFAPSPLTQDIGGAFINSPPQLGTIGVAPVSDQVLFEVMPVKPMYPPKMLARGIEGSVIVMFDVTAAGRVSNPRIVSSTHRGFEKAALKAIERFRFKPRVVDGEPRSSENLRKQFNFELEN